MARVLGIGIATLDIVNFVDHYPVEDEELRAVDRQIRRGGNATNTLVVLSQLGHRCAWAGVLAQDVESDVIETDLRSYDIDLASCQRAVNGCSPVSCIIANRSNGSRTIVHYRNLPELSFEAFAAIDLGVYDWLHFEGRNVGATRQMLNLAADRGFPNGRISVEIEKDREGVETLLSGPGVLLLSHAFARAKNLQSAEATLAWARSLAADADLVCAWGVQGAWCLNRNQDLVHAPGMAVARVVDSVGAGDTFNAGVIHGRLAQRSWGDTLAAANRLAARKCAQVGFAGLDAAAAGID